MFKKLIIVYTLLSLIIMGCSGQRQLLKDSESYFNKGLAYFEDEKYSKAKNHFKNIVDKYSGTEITVDGDDVLIMRESDILAIL